MLLLVMDVVARGGLEFVGAPRQGERSHSKVAFLSTLPAMGGASVTLLQWDREAADSIRLAAGLECHSSAGYRRSPVVRRRPVPATG